MQPTTVLPPRASACSGGADGSVRRFSLSHAGDLPTGGVSLEASAEADHDGRVQALAWMAAGTAAGDAGPAGTGCVLVSAGRSCAIVAHDPVHLRSVSVVPDAHGPGVVINAAAVIPCARRDGSSVLITGGSDGTVCAWGMERASDSGERSGALRLSPHALGRWNAWADLWRLQGDGNAAAATNDGGGTPLTPAAAAVEGTTSKCGVRVLGMLPTATTAAGGAGVGGGEDEKNTAATAMTKRRNRVLCGFADGTLAVIEVCVEMQQQQLR